MVYLYGKAGSKSAIKITSIEVYTNMLTLGQRILQEWANANEKTRERNKDAIKIGPHALYKEYDLSIFIKQTGNFKIYTSETDTSSKPKKFNRDKLWELMQSEEGLKKPISIALLKL